MGGDRIESASIDLIASMIVNGSFSNYIEPSDAILLGDGVFETLRTYENRVFALHQHLERLKLGLNAIEVEEFDLARLREGIEEILVNEPFPSGALRISVYSDGTWVISHKEYLPAQKGISCRTLEATNISRTYKSASYSDRMSYRRAAKAGGFDDAILFNSDGLVTELSTSNLILRSKGEWTTPSLEAGALSGITRTLLIENFGVRESRVTVNDLEGVEAAAAISSLREIHQIKKIDGKDLPISNELKALQDSFHSWILGNLSL